MGVIGMAMLTILGSFMVGKVGGAEKVGALRADIAAIFGSQMADPDLLTVRVVGNEGEMGLLIEYTPAKNISRSEGSIQKQMKRIASFVMGTRYWSKRAAFVTVRANRPVGKPLEERFERPADPRPS
jgi:hypothetical protein